MRKVALDNKVKMKKNADGKKPQPLDPSKKGEKDKNTNPDEEIFRKSGEEETEKGAKDRTIVEDLGGEKDFEKKAAETKAMLEAQKLTEQQTAENIEQNEGAGKGEALQNLTIVTESEIKQDLAETVNILHDAKDTLDKAGGKNQTQQQATKEAPTLNSVTTDVVTPQTTTAIKEGDS
jgi:hypothetical protein